MIDTAELTVTLHPGRRGKDDWGVSGQDVSGQLCPAREAKYQPMRLNAVTGAGAKSGGRLMSAINSAIGTGTLKK